MASLFVLCVSQGDGHFETQLKNIYKNTNLSKQRKAERDYYHEQFEIHKNDLRNSWKIIKEMIGKVYQHKVKKTPNIPYK